MMIINKQQRISNNVLLCQTLHGGIPLQEVRGRREHIIIISESFVQHIIQSWSQGITEQKTRPRLSV